MSDSVQITLRIGPRFCARAEQLRNFVSREVGSSSTRADVFRRALAIGLRELERRCSREGADNDTAAVPGETP